MANSTIWLSKETIEKLKSIGTFQESYDELITRLIDAYKRKL